MGNIKRAALAVLLGVALVGCSAAPANPVAPSSSPATVTAADAAPIKEIEQKYGVRIGLAAVNVHTGQTMSHRDGERFPLLSTFKMYAAAALLRQHPLSTGYFDKVVTYTAADLVTYSPVTSQHVGTGMTVAALCEAAITLSDNAAGNLMLKELGGPSGLTAFARSIGDKETRLDRWETELNTAIPGDERDTTTPAAYLGAFRSIMLGDVLGKPEREQLTNWLLGNKTGDERIRAGVPADWKTADKTGTGDYGAANDLGVTWTPDGTPIVMVSMTTKPKQDAESDSAPIAAAAKAAAEALN